jgi:hypothetical protein
MKARSVTFGALLACGLMVAGQGVASANMAWCLSDPPIQVLSPGGHYLVVNNLVYLPPSALHLKNQIYDDAAAAPDGKGGTLITVHVHVPASVNAHVVSSENRYQVTTQRDGATVITLYLDVPTT